MSKEGERKEIREHIFVPDAGYLQGLHDFDMELDGMSGDQLIAYMQNAQKIAREHGYVDVVVDHDHGYYDDPGEYRLFGVRLETDEEFEKRLEKSRKAKERARKAAETRRRKKAEKEAEEAKRFENDEEYQTWKELNKKYGKRK